MKKKIKFCHVPLSLQSGIIYIPEPKEVINSTVAIYNKSREKLVIRPEYFEHLELVQTSFPFLSTYRVQICDGFIVNTWDERL